MSFIAHKLKAHYSVSIASSLIAYAEKNKLFQDQLVHMLHSMPIVLPTYAEFPFIDDYSRYSLLEPKSIRSAELRAQWLMMRIADRDLPGSTQAALMLIDYIKDKPYENPKQLVVGFVRVAIPGITLGRFKLKNSVSVIVNHKAKKQDAELAKATARVCAGLIAEALTMARGKILKLEPEIADWLFGDRELDLYTATTDEIGKIRQELKQTKVMHSYSHGDNGIEMLAISPAVNSSYQESKWNIEAL
jgi:hypothetical protein